MKTLEFKLWKWFIPLFGLFYLMWYGWITVIKKKYKDGMNEKINDLHPLAYLGFMFYTFVHVYAPAFLIAWIMTLIGII